MGASLGIIAITVAGAGAGLLAGAWIGEKQGGYDDFGFGQAIGALVGALSGALVGGLVGLIVALVILN